MNTRNIAEEFRLSHWAGIMRERQESGLSIKAFCKSSGFHENVYFYWQRKLREAACKGLIGNAQSETTAAGKSLIPSEAPRAGWVTVSEAAEPAKKEEVLPIEISGCRVLASADVDTELLAKVCRVLIGL